MSTRRSALIVVVLAVMLAALSSPAAGRDKPSSTSDLNVFTAKLGTPSVLVESPFRGNTGGSFSKQQIAKLTCTAEGDPATYVDISCPEDEEVWGDYSPDNEIAIAVDPLDAEHLLAGSNDYFYRFNNANGSRQALVPTGFFTSFDGGATWLDGQVPMRTGNGAGDPVPAFNAAFANEFGSMALMAQLENTAGAGGFWVTRGDISVSRSLDGGVTWEPPVTVMKGQGAGIGPANNAVFWDKEWMTVDNNPESDYFGRIYVTATRFLNGLQGSYAESPIYLSYSDDGGVTWTKPKEISGSHPSCTFQSAPPLESTECDEDQFSIPVVAPDGTLYVHFHNYQNDSEWEVGDLFDAQIMLTWSNDGGETFSDPVQVVQLEDGLADMPYSVIGRQTVWGHQIRWASAGNITVDPDSRAVTVVWSDRGAANADPTVAAGCIFDAATAPDYDPCNAGPGAVISVYQTTSNDGCYTWTAPAPVAYTGTSQWFPWAGYMSDGTLVVAWDQDTAVAPADVFRHVLSVGGAAPAALGPDEHIDESLTHWAGQYTTAWPEICGPAGSGTPGKACNVFHGDYTGLAVGPDDAVHVVWTGLNAFVTSAQIDFFTGEFWSAYRQDAMYAQR
jgi:hypothetical protein